ncbi:MAG: hypothetical protein E7519_09030 [Ruminococcaceae bacterium]|nr:hypothetical protein [Oscillospiraceae bacterium]
MRETRSSRSKTQNIPAEAAPNPLGEAVATLMLVRKSRVVKAGNTTDCFGVKVSFPGAASEEWIDCAPVLRK